MQKARYVRVSTANQNKERQLIRNHPDEQLFIDICSGSIPFSERDQGTELLKAIEGNEIYYLSVHAVDRLGRNLIDILTTLKKLDDSGIIVKIDSLGIESRINNKANPAFGMITTVIGQVAQMERETLLERQKEGIALAKIKGKYKGRARGTSDTKEEILIKYKGVVKLLSQGYSIRKIAKLEGASAGTVMKVKRLIDS